MASFTKEVSPGLAKRPLQTNGRLAYLELTSIVKEATDKFILCIPRCKSLVQNKRKQVS